MYLNFYELQEKPFEPSPNPRFLYMSKAHEEALARMTYCVGARKGFHLLTGDVGTGKTTLLNALLQELNGSIHTVMINNPRISTADLYRSLYLGFGFKARYKSKVNFLKALHNFLKQGLVKGQNAVLIIDEAQALPINLLEEVRLLSNLEIPEQKLLNILLVGQPELRQNLMGFEMRALYQRINLQYHLRPLNKKDTCTYIQKRLVVAGAADPNLFTHRALKLIHQYTKGYPRIINILCDNALISGFVKEKRVINHHIIHESARDVGLSGRELPTLDCWSPNGSKKGSFFSRAFGRC